MPMDPLAALGLAANIVQFFDFAWELFSDARAIHRSKSSTSAENQFLETLTVELQLLTRKLRDAPATAGIELKNIASLCQEVADQILKALNDIKVKGPKKRWKSFMAALKGVWAGNDIKVLVDRLEQAQRQLMTCLLVTFDSRLSESSNKQSKIITMIETMESQGMSMGLDHMKEIQKLRRDVLSSVNGIEEETQRAWTAIRDLAASVRDLPVAQEKYIDSITTKLHTLSLQVSGLVAESRAGVLEQTILRSLQFKQMKVRQSDIKDAFPATFDWIFEDPDSRRSGCLFRHWLEHSSGIYWIEGKPGSGKSTLMKYLCSNKRTRQLLGTWAKGKRLVISQYFFWNAGSPMQKSQQGLLQTLLYDILRQCPHLIRDVCSSHWHDHVLYQDSNELWTKSDLLEAFRKLLQLKVGINFCFFIDGLDEYDGDHSELVDIIESWPQSEEIKLCLSSRPRTVFKDAFGQDTATKITLEDFTLEDIEKYVHGRLNAHKRFSWKIRRDKQYQELVDEIVEKSQGVFLWVFLVVKDLLQGVTNADPIPLLRQRLKEIPPELEAYFEQILSSIEERYQCQTAITFQVALAAAEPLPLFLYSLLDEGVWEHSPEASVAPISRSQVAEAEEDMRRRLDARTKSLLEATAPQKTKSRHGPIYVVDFLHRTVRDFLLGKEMQAMFQRKAPPSFNPRKALSRVILVRVKQIAASYKGDKREQVRALCFIDNIIHYAHTIEIQDGVAELDVLNEAEKVITEFVTPNQAIEARNVFIGVAVSNNLRLFTTSKLKSEAQNVRMLDNSLLLYALQPWRNRVIMELGVPMGSPALKNESSGLRTCEIDVGMVELLLAHGASARSVFVTFITTLCARKLSLAENEKRTLLPTIALLLQHGARLSDGTMEPGGHECCGCDSSGPCCGPSTEYLYTVRKRLPHIFDDKQTRWLIERAGETPVEPNPAPSPHPSHRDRSW